MTKIDTKEIFEIAYAFKTAKWGMTQPIQFLPQAHKFGEDVLNLIEAYGEAQRKIEAIGKTAVAMLGESACDRHSGLFKEMPFHEFQAVHTACGCVYCCKEMLDEAQKEIKALEEITTNHCDKQGDLLIEAESRISTLEALLEKILKIEPIRVSMHEDLYCVYCDNTCDQEDEVQHKPDCLFTRIQKELGEG